jgi:hypothetical protein
VNALAAALDLLLHDEALRARLGAAARATMETEMSAAAMAEKLAGHFFQALGRAAPAPAETA